MKNANEILDARGLSELKGEAGQPALIARFPEKPSTPNKSRGAIRVTQSRALRWLRKLLEGTEARI